MRAVVLLFPVVLLAGCSSSGSPTARPSATAPAPSPQRTGPRLSGTVVMTEAANAHLAFSTPAQVVSDGSATAAPSVLTCASWASGAGGAFAVPQFDVTSGDHSIYFDALLTSGYHGPGTYTSATDPALAGTVVVGVGIAPGQQGAFSIFRSGIHGASALTVHRDGSGTFQISEWGSDEVRGDTGSAGAVSGTVTWTCS